MYFLNSKIYYKFYINNLHYKFIYSIFIINLTINRRNKMKKTVKNLTVGLLVVLLANVGILVVDQDVAMAASCNLSITSNMFGSSTSGYVGNPRTSINSINTGLSCFWNC